jgi:hypothetical protein
MNKKDKDRLDSVGAAIGFMALVAALHYIVKTIIQIRYGDLDDDDKHEAYLGAVGALVSWCSLLYGITITILVLFFTLLTFFIEPIFT